MWSTTSWPVSVGRFLNIGGRGSEREVGVFFLAIGNCPPVYGEVFPFLVSFSPLPRDFAGLRSVDG